MGRDGAGLVFCRPGSAMGFGHVAWGYTRSLAGVTSYTGGSVEDSRALPIAPPAMMEYWQETVPETSLHLLVGMFRRLGYVNFKRWPVADADPVAADAVSREQSRKTYYVAGNNCLDSVHRILTAYGSPDFDLEDLRHPRTWIPNSWFRAIPVAERPLDELADGRSGLRATG